MPSDAITPRSAVHVLARSVAVRTSPSGIGMPDPGVRLARSVPLLERGDRRGEGRVSPRVVIPADSEGADDEPRAVEGQRVYPDAAAVWEDAERRFDRIAHGQST